MTNIVSATIRLLETKSPQDITLREVAEESGHGHRLIVEWFGSKGDLFTAVFNQVFENLVKEGLFFYADIPTRPEVRKVFQLFDYMRVQHPDFIKDVQSGRFVEIIQERIKTNLGVPPAQASTAARRLSVLVIGISLFAELLEVSNEEAVAMMQDEFKATTGFDLSDNPER